MMMMASNSKQFNDINITPLTDIFLVLLIIMMVIAPLLNYKGLKLEIPSVQTSPLPRPEVEPLKLQLNADGTLINQSTKHAVALEALSAVIRPTATAKPLAVQLQVTPQASYKAVTRVIDTIQASGASQLSIQPNG
ncbi:MAG: ExbD/TolR family protein [Vampirovibrionales bacterium]